MICWYQIRRNKALCCGQSRGGEAFEGSQEKISTLTQTLMREAISSGKGFFSKTRRGKDCWYETRQMNWRKSYAPSLRAAKHFLTYQEAKAVSSHAKRSSLLRRLMAWHKDSWQTAKTGLSGGDRSGDVRSESYATCLPTHWSPAGERREAHKSTEKKWKK